jgi:hypothetical protein
MARTQAFGGDGDTMVRVIMTDVWRDLRDETLSSESATIVIEITQGYG